jgi:phosphatidylglycerol:prolipoprotein diacylglycerol transferase
MLLLAQFLNFLGYFVGGAVFIFQAKRRKLATEGMGLILLAALVGGLVGAKLTEWIFGAGAPLFNSPAAFFDPFVGGRSILGGVVVGWLCVEITKKRLGITRKTGDMFAFALPTGEAVGRLGCFVGGCCYGIGTSAPWAVYQHGEWRHPTQLYSSFAALITLGVVYFFRNRVPEGALFPVYLMMFGGSRLIIEFFRESEVVFAGLSVAQLVCAEIVISSGILLVFRLRTAKGKEVLEIGRS